MFVRGKKKIGFEIKGKLVYEKGWVDVLEANEYGDYESVCSTEFKDSEEQIAVFIRESIRAFVEGCN